MILYYILLHKIISKKQNNLVLKYKIMQNSLTLKNMINNVIQIGKKYNQKKIRKQLVIIMFKLQKDFMERILKTIFINKMVFYKYKKKMLELLDQKMIIYLKNIDFQRLNKEMLVIQENIKRKMLLELNQNYRI